VDIDVLGALAVRVGGISIAPTAPKPRQVLAVLAVNADQVVPVGDLIEELWGDRPPRSARNTLQTYVLQLREQLAVALSRAGERRSAKDVLATLPGGYQLDSCGGTSDFREFERRATAGYRAVAAEDFAGAARRLREALALWKGSAFAGVRAGSLLEVEIRRLEEARLCALEQGIDVELRLGRHRELVAELTVLVNRHRMHEGLHRQLMLALHHSGRRGEALAVYQRLRATLVRELGMEPSPGLRRLQHAILADGPERLAPDLDRRPSAGPETGRRQFAHAG
jgi:DNA-binding SARP family transcriptional activator